MAKREGRDAVDDPGEYDPSQEPSYGYHPTSIPQRNDGRGYEGASLVYGGTGGEMAGKYGNNFVNMQAYLQANTGAKHMTFGHPSTQGGPNSYYEPQAGYGQGMSQLDRSMAGFTTPTRDPQPEPERPAPAPVGGIASAAGRPAMPAGPVYDPGTQAAATQAPAPHDTGAQAAQQGFAPPDFSQAAGNFDGMGQTMANRKQPGGMA